MTIYEATHSNIGCIIVAYADDDFELVMFKIESPNAMSTVKFSSIEDTFIHLHQEVLKQDVTCPSCRKRINRQIKRAQEKYNTKKEI